MPISAFVATILAGSSSATAFAACKPDALGTHRTITLDAAKHKRFIGHEKRLGLKAKEVILTFDDGPMAGTTQRILDTLKAECVKATFFTVGRMAKANPRLVKRIVAQGHTLAHHTHAHQKLIRFRVKQAERYIERGINTVEKIAYGEYDGTPKVPFFRYPYLARTKATDRMVAGKGLIAFDANIDSLDWKKVSPQKVHDRTMRVLRREGKGIILMHDIQHRTAKMLPELLRSLKAGGYKVVHIAPPSAPIIGPVDEPSIVVASTEINQTQSSPSQPPSIPKRSRTGSISPVEKYTTAQSKALMEQALADMAPVDDLGADLMAEKPRRIADLSTHMRPSAKKVSPIGQTQVAKTSTFNGWKLRPTQWILR